MRGATSTRARLTSLATELAVDAPESTTYATLSPERHSELLDLLRRGAKRKLWRRS